jgi:RNA polymerase primary sigma factor
MTASQVHASDGISRRGSDSMTWYLASIGREPLLTAAEEIELGNQVQAMMVLVEQKRDTYSPHERKIIKVGRRSKERMMKANLRLVVSVAKKYQGKGRRVPSAWNARWKSLTPPAAINFPPMPFGGSARA